MAKFSQDVTRRTIADVNAANAAAYGAGGEGETDWKATSKAFGYGEGYPVGPNEGLSPINSVAELQRANARAYGEAETGGAFGSPTNMVGDSEGCKYCGEKYDRKDSSAVKAYEFCSAKCERAAKTSDSEHSKDCASRDGKSCDCSMAHTGDVNYSQAKESYKQNPSEENKLRLIKAAEEAKEDFGKYVENKSASMRRS